MVREVGGEEVGVDCVGHVGGDEEGVCVGLGGEVRAWACGGFGGCGGGGGGETLDDALDGGGEEVAAGALAEEGTDFFVVEYPDEFDDAAGACIVGVLGGGSVWVAAVAFVSGTDECLDGGPGAEFVVDAAAVDELLV